MRCARRLRSFSWIACSILSFVGNVALGEGTYVSGIAVYRDGESKEVRRAAGVQLFFVAGAFQNPVTKTPPMIIVDEDITASRFNGHRLQEEGIFLLHAKDKIAIVSVV